MRAFYLVPVIGVLTACDPAVPDSAAGVGFNTPEYQAQREAVLEGQTINGDPLIPPSAVSTEGLAPAQAGGLIQPNPIEDPITTTATAYAPQPTDTAEDIARETAAALAAANANSGVAPVEASPSNPAPDLISSPSISDEQDFQAVASRQTIQSDAERIAQNRANYQVIAPTALPERTSDGTPNVVQYALSTSHPKGTQMYSRSGFNLAAKAQRNCAGFASPDQAQAEFLANGGPQRDRKGLDPDGDGYACAWDPAPFRRAVQN
ncbi:hypothetical protein [Ruegeria sp. PrR005]|uniref:Excalibur calcium-binding domain-containing protein n=1 Tax=Ruegeria sp. PrR005 TaxID=2706882 RepID=A0A6B2NQH9_9RHOB|nr:hypothetical protein [Ruegeria sp. PrR005]NDW44827.1 hypothetical protein [Ruegeria sp. PrR005]